MPPVQRFLCHLLIVWLTLLSGSTYAHATSDAAAEVGHMATHLLVAQGDGDAGDGAFAPAHDHGPADCCSQTHCCHGHSTGMLASTNLCVKDASAGTPSPAHQAPPSREHAHSIERPKWAFTTPAVVSL